MWISCTKGERQGGKNVIRQFGGRLGEFSLKFYRNFLCASEWRGRARGVSARATGGGKDFGRISFGARGSGEERNPPRPIQLSPTRSLLISMGEVA